MTEKSHKETPTQKTVESLSLQESERPAKRQVHQEAYKNYESTYDEEYEHLKGTYFVYKK